MSGGSWDYAYRWVEGMAERLEDEAGSPERVAFAAHMRLVADAMQAIEWVDSCDWSPGDENDPIRKCLTGEAYTRERSGT